MAVKFEISPSYLDGSKIAALYLPIARRERFDSRRLFSIRGVPLSL
jgi:hypothetical protein